MLPDADTRVPTWDVLGPLLIATAAEGLAWGWLLGVETAGWYANPGVLVGVHTLTIGVVVMAMVGAGWQLVPVVTAVPWGRFYPARWVNGGLLIAFPGLLWGFGHPGTMMGAAVLAVGALLVRSAAIILALRQGARLAVRLWLVMAELCLWAGLGVGLMLWLARSGHGVGLDTWTWLHRHVALLLGGWVGGWIVGLGSLLLPMFAVSREPSPVVLGVAGLCWFTGIFVGSWPLWIVGVVLGPGALLLSLARGLRLGAPMVQAGLGVLGLVSAAALLRWGPPDQAVRVALALGVLPLIHGVAQRIVPFFLWTSYLAPFAPRAPAASGLLPVRYVPVQAGLSLVGGLTWVLGWEPVGALLLLLGALAQGALLLSAAWAALRARNALLALPGMGIK